MDSYKVYIVSAMNEAVLTMDPIKKQNFMGLYVSTKKWQPNQIFQFLKTKGHYVIKNIENDKVLDLKKESKQIYGDVVGYDFHGKENQLWMIEEPKEGFFYITSVSTGMVIEIEGGIDADGIKIVQNKKYNHLNQLWTFKVI